MTAETAYIDLHKIIVNGGSQPRAALDEETIARYAEAMENGTDFPPIVGLLAVARRDKVNSI